jgi:hypothetical protein
MINKLPFVNVKLTFEECHYLYDLLQSHVADDKAAEIARVIQRSARHDLPASISWIFKG